MHSARLLVTVSALLAGPAGAVPPVLVEQTGPAGLVATHMPDAESIPLLRERMIGGMAVGDFNRDGAPDLFWIGSGGTPDKLFINDGSGVFTDEAAAWGIADMHCGSGASVGDYDGDGDPDIYVTSFGVSGAIGPGHNRLYRNDGASFTEVAASAGVNFTSPTAADGYGSAWGDFDLDGDLDLFVTTHTTGASGESDGNRLYRNEGDGTFTDVTAASGIGATIDGVRGFQPSFVDMNEDLYPELLISADFTTSRYYINNGNGTFTDFTGPSGTGLDANGMGQTVADFDGNGVLDWYVTSVHLEYEWSPTTPGTGNMLYMGAGGHLYNEDSIARGVNDGGWGWATVAVDMDQDGREEILEVNGWPAGDWIGERGKLFYNLGGTFFEMALATGFDTAHDGRSMVFMDVEGDGDLDIAVGNNGGPLQFYRNDTAGGAWLRVALDTSGNPLLAPDGFGARVTTVAGGQSRVRFMSGSPSYLATSEHVLHFGLGAADTVDELSVTWPRGQVTTLAGVPVNQMLVIEAPRLGDIDADGVVGINDFLALLSLWGPVTGAAGLPADLDADGLIGITDFLILLSNWGA